MWNISRQPFAREEHALADEPSEAVSDISRLAEKMAEMRTQLATIRPAFRYTGPVTVGGIPSASSYQVYVPINGPCEVCVVSQTNTDNSAALTLELSLNPNLDVTTANTSNMTASLDGNQQFLYLAALGTSSTVPGADCWFPISGDQQLFVRVNGSGSKAGYITLQFRYRINPAGVENPGY